MDTSLSFEALPIRSDINPEQLRAAREQVEQSHPLEQSSNPGLGRGAISHAYTTVETPRGYGSTPEISASPFDEYKQIGHNILALRSYAKGEKAPRQSDFDLTA